METHNVCTKNVYYLYLPIVSSISVANVIPFRAYNSSRLYRELKLRGAIILNKKIRVLSQENVFSTLHGVWNLSSDQGSLGTFIVTNIRLVWFADMNENFNISLPYLQVDSVSIKQNS